MPKVSGCTNFKITPWMPLPEMGVVSTYRRALICIYLLKASPDGRRTCTCVKDRCNDGQYEGITTGLSIK